MENLYELMEAQQQKKELVRILECNERSARFGLLLTQEQAQELMVCRKDTLKEQRRVEFGRGILPDLIDAFCDSGYMQNDSYAQTLAQLQDIFYLYKNESADILSDQELLEFMREQYEEVCFGDMDYLQSTCLERFVREIRGGYEEAFHKKLKDEYTLRESCKSYEKVSEETRWEFELYREKLEEME